jgi:hypothetical protein
MLSIKLFRLVFCLFRFNQNIETLCFGLEAKPPKQTISKQTKTNQKKTKKPTEKIPKYAPYQTVSVVICLFQFNRNIENLCFSIEAKKQNKCFVSDSAESSFGSSFGPFVKTSFEKKDTLVESKET